MTTRNGKGRNSGKSATQKTTTRDSKALPKKRQDMSFAAQRRLALKELRRRRRHTYFLRARGISHPAARIMELIAMGYKIESHRVTAVDSDGFTHHGVAMYELVDERDSDLVDMMLEGA
ncbi:MULTISPECIES: helix-turn-helix domain-containing protein [unclassified Burkholderia]|uniref:helix-turn-helix domain-containing protein n=1 Tax=unclassified Burkholderia TaxID=2613784 RepID=UPI000F5A060C|nr:MULTISPECIES: helix-turn-helix domain-containing protein [unclassified Burkholderia]RQS22460.1 hypothetical protein DIE05_30025 [Burkholderia sp. Bp8995]RQS39230.1 hypothetical protein DIE00_34060 [Burkholderia sp. Bp8989]